MSISKEVCLLDNISKSVLPVEYGRYVVDNENEFRVIELLEGFTEITGYTMEDVRREDLKLTSFVPDEDREAYKEYLKLIFEGKAGTFLQHRFVRKDGFVMQVLCFGEIFTDEKGVSCSKITICNVALK